MIIKYRKSPTNIKKQKRNALQYKKKDQKERIAFVQRNMFDTGAAKAFKIQRPEGQDLSVPKALLMQ